MLAPAAVRFAGVGPSVSYTGLRRCAQFFVHCAPRHEKRTSLSRFLRTPWRSRSASRAVDRASLATGVALVRALAAFDAETAEHSATVALYARDVALRLGADGDSAAGIQLGALVHDVGKLSLPVGLLLKPDPLNDEEWALMREHPEAGARILAGLPVEPHADRDRAQSPRARGRRRLSRGPQGHAISLRKRASWASATRTRR